MKIKWFEKTKILTVIQLVLILSWLTNLQDSEAYFFVNGLMAMAGVFCLLENDRKGMKMPASWKVWTGILAAVFSAAAVLANYFLFEPIYALFNLMNLTLSLLGGWVIGFHILGYFGGMSPASEKGSEGTGKHPGKIFLMSFLSVAVIDLMYLFFASYPGIMTSDSVNQVRQIYTGSYDNWHPYWHTAVIRVFLLTGNRIFGSYQAGVAVFSVFQVCFLSAAISYAVTTMYQRGLPVRYLWLVWGFYALLPYHIAYSVTMWKDIFFAISCLVMITALYRLLSKMDKTAKIDGLVFFLASICFCIWRSNGLPAFAMLFVAFMLFFRKQRKILAAMGVALILGYLLTGPVLSALGVRGGNYVEMLSVPLQQVARVIHDGKPLTAEEQLLVEAIASEQDIREAYQPELSDPVKAFLWNPEGGRTVRENSGAYLRLWANLGMRYPAEYIKAWIDQTKGYWSGGYQYWVLADGIFPNDLGICAEPGGNIIAKLFAAYFRYFEMIPFLHPLISIGLNAWIVILCGYVSLRKKRQEWLLTIPILAVLASLIVSTPVYSEFRYIYSMFLSLPLILTATVLKTKE